MHASHEAAPRILPVAFQLLRPPLLRQHLHTAASPVVIWSDSIRPPVLEVQVRLCRTEAKEVRFLGGRGVGASKPTESK